MRRAPVRPSRHRLRGVGLVELMIGLVLGLIVAAAASMMFLGTRQAYRTTDGMSRMQESVRSSFDLMIREVREGGGTPCDARLHVANVLNNAQGSTPTWWAAWTDPVRGFGGTDNFAGVSFGTAAGERVSGTDAILVRYATTNEDIAVAAHDPGNARFTLNRLAHGVRAGDVVMVCNYRQGAVFTVTSASTAAGTFDHENAMTTPGNCSKGLGLPVLCTAVGNAYTFTPASRVGQVTVAGWYIGNNGRADTGGRSLYRVTRMGTEEIAEGVREMTLTYLVDGAVAYVGAASITDWSAVTAVRFDLTVESSETHTSTQSATPRLTRTVSITANLRNLLP